MPSPSILRLVLAPLAPPVVCSRDCCWMDAKGRETADDAQEADADSSGPATAPTFGPSLLSFGTDTTHQQLPPQRLTPRAFLGSSRKVSGHPWPFTSTRRRPMPILSLSGALAFTASFHTFDDRLEAEPLWQAFSPTCLFHGLNPYEIEAPESAGGKLKSSLRRNIGIRNTAGTTSLLRPSHR
ncbi:hypothetical protein OIDMADRAFT_36144 [Oidiodendron maius Zn]|uniref:Secreted protein n=1 Tax=Oidiodendron maius (strain Zn) TaxID=913774 RepID=A0A0C3GNA1_OIDMZ|nr:hypothetical protein OIDMADRAFT_36144 [Oidiodendron maius Zn]